MAHLLLRPAIILSLFFVSVRCTERTPIDDMIVVEIAADSSAIREVLRGIRTDANALWWGFDSRNQTARLQAAIRSGARRLTIPSVGRPWIIDPIVLESNQDILLEPGTVLQARRGSFLGVSDVLVSAYDDSNITVEGTGAILSMWRTDYASSKYPKGEWRHCLGIFGCRNIRVNGLRLTNSGGDGIAIGGSARTPLSTKILITNVVCDSNYRQGITIGSAEDLTIEKCTMSNTGGTAPSAGLDIEPDFPYHVVSKILIKECTMVGNTGFGLQIGVGLLDLTSRPISVTIESTRIGDNQDGGLWIVGPNSGGKKIGKLEFINCQIAGRQAIQNDSGLEILFR